jgi:hypothetical protein
MSKRLFMLDDASSYEDSKRSRGSEYNTKYEGQGRVVMDFPLLEEEDVRQIVRKSFHKTMGTITELTYRIPRGILMFTMQTPQSELLSQKIWGSFAMINRPPNEAWMYERVSFVGISDSSVDMAAPPAEHRLTLQMRGNRHIPNFDRVETFPGDLIAWRPPPADTEEREVYAKKIGDNLEPVYQAVLPASLYPIKYFDVGRVFAQTTRDVRSNNNSLAFVNPMNDTWSKANEVTPRILLETGRRSVIVAQAVALVNLLVTTGLLIPNPNRDLSTTRNKASIDDLLKFIAEDDSEQTERVEWLEKFQAALGVSDYLTEDPTVRGTSTPLGNTIISWLAAPNDLMSKITGQSLTDIQNRVAMNSESALASQELVTNADTILSALIADRVREETQKVIGKSMEYKSSTDPDLHVLF